MKLRIPIDVLRAEVHVFIGSTEEARKHLPEDLCFRGGYLARTWQYGEAKKFRVYIHSETAALSVIAHEAVHAASFILDHLHIKADFNNDELQAYIVQFIVEKVENALEKQ